MSPENANLDVILTFRWLVGTFPALELGAALKLVTLSQTRQYHGIAVCGVIKGGGDKVNANGEDCSMVRRSCADFEVGMGALFGSCEESAPSIPRWCFSTNDKVLLRRKSEELLSAAGAGTSNRPDVFLMIDPFGPREPGNEGGPAEVDLFPATAAFAEESALPLPKLAFEPTLPARLLRLSALKSSISSLGIHAAMSKESAG